MPTRHSVPPRPASGKRAPRLILALLASLVQTEACAEEHSSTAHRGKRAHVVQDTAQLWPDNTVYYSLSNASPGARRAFLLAARHIAENSHVQFVEHTDQANYVYLSSSDLRLGCSSELGMNGGPQSLDLSSFCLDRASVLHEVMHVLGFHHEQQRADQAQHISVVPALKHDINFIPLRNGRLIGAYDHESIMHYGPEYGRYAAAFRRLDGDARVDAQARAELSSGDIAALRQLYPPRAGDTGRALPGDNGLGAKLSKRMLLMTPNSRTRVEIKIPPTIQVERVSAWSEPAASVQQRLVKDHHYQLDITAHGVGEARIFFRYSTTQGRSATIILEARIVEPDALSRHARQLVSPFNQRCLRARPNVAAREKGPSPDFPDDHELAWTPVAARELDIDLAECDGDDPWQEWLLQANGQLSIARLNTRACLVPDAQGRLGLEECDCKPNAPPAHQRWRQHKGRLEHVQSRQVLTHTSGNIPMLYPAGSSWQKWTWR